MNFKYFFITSGWFRGRWGAVLSLGGLVVALGPWFIGVETWLCFVLTLIGSILSLLGSYEAKAKQFGFMAPFTNDPLGWREAKKSYHSADASGEGEENINA